MGFRYVSPVTQKGVMLDWELTLRSALKLHVLPG